jgi:hypothetical protein
MSLWFTELLSSLLKDGLFPLMHTVHSMPLATKPLTSPH